MKPFTVLIICCLLALSSQAQWSYKSLSSQKHFLYTSGDLIVSDQNAGNLGLNYVYNNKLCVSVGYTATGKNACSPPILKSGEIPTSIKSAQPFENNENFHIMAGKIFNLARKKSIRLVIQGGPALTTYREPDFSLEGTNNQFYDYKMVSLQKISFVMHPKLELPLGCTIGFSVGPMLVVNDTEKYVGAGIGLMYGILKRNN